MIFTREQLLADWCGTKVQPQLRVLMMAADNLCWQIAGRPLCITNVFGDYGKTKTHSEGRAVDVRTFHVGEHRGGDLIAGVHGTGYLKHDQVARLESVLNEQWVTGAKFSDGSPMLVAVVHDMGLGHHLHLQVARGGLLRRREEL